MKQKRKIDIGKPISFHPKKSGNGFKLGANDSSKKVMFKITNSQDPSLLCGQYQFSARGLQSSSNNTKERITSSSSVKSKKKQQKVKDRLKVLLSSNQSKPDVKRAKQLLSKIQKISKKQIRFASPEERFKKKLNCISMSNLRFDQSSMAGSEE